MTDTDQPTTSVPTAPAAATEPTSSPKKSKPAAKKKAAEKKTPDPTDVELRFSGDDQLAMRGVPARDLTGADIDRIVYRRTVPGPGAAGLNRGEPGFSEARAKTVRALMATGHFKKRS